MAAVWRLCAAEHAGNQCTCSAGASTPTHNGFATHGPRIEPQEGAVVSNACPTGHARGVVPCAGTPGTLGDLSCSTLNSNTTQFFIMIFPPADN